MGKGILVGGNRRNSCVGHGVWWQGKLIHVCVYVRVCVCKDKCKDWWSVLYVWVRI